MNGQRLLIPADSATTVQEMCHAIARKIGLRETAGFSLYAAIYKRVSFIYFHIAPEEKKAERHHQQTFYQRIVSTNATFLHSYTRISFTTPSIVGKMLQVFDLTWDVHTRTYRARTKITQSLRHRHPSALPL